MKLSITASAIAVITAMGALPAMADSHGNDFVHSRTNNGQYYVMYQTHMSLYTFKNDTAGVSTCYDTCAQNWPPAVFPASTPMGENYSLIQRSDGSLQAAYKGQPLYLSNLDKKIGDTNGDGVGNVWVLARPEMM